MARTVHGFDRIFFLVDLKIIHVLFIMAGMTGDFPLEMLVTVTLEERAGKTTMTLRHSGLPVGEMKEQTGTGWNQSFDKLADALDMMKKIPA